MKASVPFPSYRLLNRLFSFVLSPPLGRSPAPTRTASAQRRRSYQSSPSLRLNSSSSSSPTATPQQPPPTTRPRASAPRTKRGGTSPSAGRRTNKSASKNPTHSCVAGERPLCRTHPYPPPPPPPPARQTRRPPPQPLRGRWALEEGATPWWPWQG